MSINLFKNKNVTQLMGRSGLVLQKYSPVILTTVGILGMIGTVILASRATIKAGPIVEQIKDDKLELKYDTERALEEGDVDWPNRNNINKEIAKVYVRGGVKLTKLYGPTITLGVGSIACILAAHGIMQRRTVALTAAYKALESTFVEYRKRVITEIGEERESNLRTNREEVTVSDGKDSKKVVLADTQAHSPYARFFDELSPNWSKTAEYNLLFLKAQQNYANDLLHARGHVFLNEVYDMLGIPRSKAGQVVGWLVSKTGDNFVDFGMYDHYNNSAHAFVNGYEHSILLDFNVDGVIFDKI
jgi:hypothetical protein